MYHAHPVCVANSWTTNSRGKRIFDFVAALFMLVLFLPVIVTVALLLKWKDSGPVFYAHTRIGKGGVPFQCYKFRTMVMDADDRLEALLKSDKSLRNEWKKSRKLRDDPRIIPRVGNLLRKSSLDELPQIINVLLGDMSLVGPRPVVEDELEYYGRRKQYYLSLRPGLTGPWQAATRSDSTYAERVRLDTAYALNGSLLDDIGIVLLTARKFLGFSASGAY